MSDCWEVVLTTVVGASVELFNCCEDVLLPALVGSNVMVDSWEGVTGEV